MFSRKEIIGNCELYLGKCQDVFPLLSGIDAIITDPPYMMNETSGSQTGIGMAHKWEGFIKAGQVDAGIAQLDFDEWIPLLSQTLNPTAHLFIFANDKQIFNLNEALLKAKFNRHNLLIWQKPNCTPNRWFMKNAEFIWFGRFGKSVPIKTLNAKTCEEFRHDSDKQHPTQKPVSLIKKLVAAVQGKIVLDPFMGSGSTGIACHQLGRKFIGIEIDEGFFNIACKRIERAQGQEGDER